MIVIVAWKNIWRNKVRSLIIMCAIVVGLFGGLFAAAFMNGLVIQRIKAAIDNECSNIQVHHPDYNLNKDLNDTIQSLSAITQTLDTIKDISGWSARLKIISMASTANANAGVLIYGINPEKEKKVTGIWRNIPDSFGSWFADDKKNRMVIGAKLAEKLKVKLKSKIILQFQAKDNSLISNSFTVTGIYKTGNSVFEGRNVFVRYADLKPLLGFETDMAHEIAIALNDDRSNDMVKLRLQQRFKNSSLESWKEIMPDLGIVSDLTIQMLYIILVIILLALCFGIVNTMLMAVMERTHEIGMLMAIGMNKAKVFQMILLETVFLSLSGGAVGMIIGAAAIRYFSVSGINLSAFTRGLEAIGYSVTVYPTLENSFYVGLTLLVVIAGIISSIIPARKALHLNPVEAIRTL
jgi:ABC-type lipoprotein release transport system permease subunit